MKPAAHIVVFMPAARRAFGVTTAQTRLGLEKGMAEC